MKDFITAAKETVLVWWLVGFYGVLFTLAALATAALSSLIGADWATMDTQGHVEVGLAVFANWATMMMAFMNKSISRIQSGQIPISPDDQQIIAQARVTTTQKTVDVTTQTSQPTNP